MNDDFVTKNEKYFKENIFQYHLKALLKICGKNILTLIPEFVFMEINPKNSLKISENIGFFQFKQFLKYIIVCNIEKTYYRQFEYADHEKSIFFNIRDHFRVPRRDSKLKKFIIKKLGQKLAQKIYFFKKVI